MKRKQHAPEQIVMHLREVDRMLGEGRTAVQVCKRIGVTEVTYYRWRKEYDGTTRDSVKRPKALEKGNTQLERLLADQVLENRVLKDIAEGNFYARTGGVRPWQWRESATVFPSGGPARS